MKALRLRFGLPICLVLLPACGTAQTSQGAHSPVTSGSGESGFALPELPSGASDVSCEPGYVMPRIVTVISAKSVTLRSEPFVEATGKELLDFDVQEPMVLASRTDDDSNHGVSDEDYRQIVLGPFIDPILPLEAIEEMLRSPSPVLIVAYRDVADGHPRPLLTMVGTMHADGYVELLGECGRLLQPSIDAAAREFKTIANADWLVRAADPPSDELAAIDRQFNAVLSSEDLFEATPPAERDLMLTHVPARYRRDYFIVPIVLAGLDSLPVGAVGFRTSGGHSSAFDTGFTGVTAALLPKDVKTVEIIYLTPKMEEILVGVVNSELFDPVNGTTLTFSWIDGQPFVTVAPMEAGALEKLMGMTREEIEAYRERLYDLGDERSANGSGG